MSRSVLFPSCDQRLMWDDHLTTLLAAAHQRVAQGAVTPTLDSDGFTAELAGFDFAQPVPFADLLGWTVAQMEHGLVHMNHPRYLGLFNPAPTFPAQCADRIAATFNPQLATATTSPAAVAIEAHVARSLARRAGLPPGAVGHFTSGGSEANETALICALTQGEPGFATTGSRAFSGQPVFYISQDSHLAWIKIAHATGIGRSAVRLVATDGTGRMSVEALSAAIAADRREGCIPVMVVATAGTTNAGMIDPLGACGDIARQAGVWYHVDAAWGGALVASDRLSGLLTGIETADSITIDAHKWFATTMGCGMFLTVHPRVLSAAFTVSASFMPSQTPTLDPYITTAQWSRRFLGLRLFLSLGAGGWAGHGAHVEHAVELGRMLANTARGRGWSVANEPGLAVVCLEPPAGSASVRDIVQQVLKSGGAWVSAARFEGRDIIRACVTHGETSPADIKAVVELLEQARTACLW
ncbi:pyridoxal phosphate-dependent decarboxylase family protein [Rhodopila sp.]|uniref:pyridoxal phosphate-dependent decarboxylase family protein n=1 Tax=Rhodopila sp. TaxID=2480087 RepID=UPI003D0ECB37